MIKKYIYRTEVHNNKVGIPSYLVRKIIQKDKEGHSISLYVLANDNIMVLLPIQLVLDYTESSMTFKSYHLGDYKLYWFPFIPNSKTIHEDETMNNLEIMLSNRFSFGWYNVLRPIIIKEGIKILKTIAEQRRKRIEIFPEKSLVFESLKKNDINNTRVAIIGQDPYPHKHACGIAFATKEKSKPLSLQKIEEAVIESGFSSLDGDLEHLLRQNVLLYNTALTVIKNNPSSHAKLWHEFTRVVIGGLSFRPEPIVFILLGNVAAKYKYLIAEHHPVFMLEHPAVAAKEKRKWKYEDVFNRTNKILKSNHKKEIIWGS